MVRRQKILFLIIVFGGLCGCYYLFNLHYAFDVDSWYFVFSAFRTIREQIRQGIFPWWNPYEGFGLPLILSGSMDLISIPFLAIFTTKDYMVLGGFFYTVLAFYGMYLFLRSEGHDPYAAVAGGMLWVTSGFFARHSHELGQIIVYVYVPLNVLLLKKMASRQRCYRYWLLFVASNALQLLSGRWDIYEYNVWIYGFYALFVIPPRQLTLSKRIKLLGLVGIGIGCAFLFIAPFTIPYLQQIVSSSRLTNSPAQARYPQLKYVLEYLLVSAHANGSAFYLSLFAFPFALLSLRKLNRLKCFAVSLAVGHLLLTYQPFQLYELLRFLPLHKGSVYVSKSCILFYFGIILLFSAAYSDFLTQFKKRHALDLVGFLGVFILGAVLLLSWRSDLRNRLNVFNLLAFVVPLGGMIACAHFRIGPERWRKIAFTTYLGSYAFVGSLLANGITSNLPLSDQQMQRSFQAEFAATLRELTRNDRALPARVADANLFSSPFFELHAVASPRFYRAFPPTILCQAVTELLEYDQCYAGYGDVSYKIDPDLTKNSVLYALSSVKYFIFEKAACDGKNFAPGTWRIVPDEHFGISKEGTNYDGLCLVENPQYFERIRFVDNFQAVKDGQAGIQFIKARNTDFEWFRQNFITTITPPFIKGAKGDFQPTYTFLQNTPHFMRLQVSSPKETMMIISNRYDDDWQVTVDKKRDILYPVNVLFQGVHIRPGTHTYDLYYRPYNYYGNFLLTAVVIGMLAALKRIRYFQQL